MVKKFTKKFVTLFYVQVKVSFEFEFPEYRYDYRRNPHVIMETLLEKSLNR